MLRLMSKAVENLNLMSRGAALSHFIQTFPLETSRMVLHMFVKYSSTQNIGQISRFKRTLERIANLE